MSDLSTFDAADYQSPKYADMKKRWAFVRLIRDLNASIKEHSTEVLPRLEAEGPKSYATRVGLTFGFNALDETIHSLVGLATRHDPELGDDTPKRLVDEWEDVDLQGTHGSVFAQMCIDAALQDGHGAILVDHPKMPTGLTLAQERDANARAYFVLVTIDRITAWRTARMNGRLVIEMVKLSEPTEVPAGAFGTQTVQRYRTLYQMVSDGSDGRKPGTPFVRFTLHEEQVSGGVKAMALIDEGEISGPEWMAFFPFYGGERTAILESKPPLRGLAYSNLEHTQVHSDHRYSMHKTAIAMLHVAGAQVAEGETLVISSDNAIFTSADGSAGFIQGAGNALAPLREAEQDIERRMGSQGYSMLRENGAAKTLGEKVLQAAREESKLSRCVRSVKDALEAAQGAKAAFYKLDDGGSIEMDQTFVDLQLTADEMRFLNELEDAGKLTLPTLLKQLKAGGRVLQGVDVDAEIDEVERIRAAEPLTDPDADPATGGAGKFGWGDGDVAWAEGGAARAA